MPVDELRRVSRFPREDHPPPPFHPSLPTLSPLASRPPPPSHLFPSPSVSVREERRRWGPNFHSTNTNDGNRPPTTDIYSSYRFRRCRPHRERKKEKGRRLRSFLRDSISTIAHLRWITMRSILYRLAIPKIPKIPLRYPGDRFCERSRAGNILVFHLISRESRPDGNFNPSSCRWDIFATGSRGTDSAVE